MQLWLPCHTTPNATAAGGVPPVLRLGFPPAPAHAGNWPVHISGECYGIEEMAQDGIFTGF